MEKEKEEEPDIHWTAMARTINKSWLGKNKANLWVCGSHRIKGTKEAECVSCKCKIYYTLDSLDFLTEDAKKICMPCAVNNPEYADEKNKEQREFLKKVLEHGN